MISPTKTQYNIGQHFIVALQQSTLLEQEAEILRKLQPTGIILFARNFDQDSKDWIKTLQKLIADCKKVSGNEQLIISIDHEGGRVHRLPEPTSRFPYARQYASKAYEVGNAMGTELRALGFNLSFSPVLDIHLDDNNPVIGERSFACNEKEVSNYAIEQMKGLHDAGILSCGKHFPGHGATIADSHFELPIRDISLEELKACELLPFKSYIEQNPPMIMSAHILFPQIDPLHAATISSVHIKGLLRETLGFEGVCISDDLEMLALSNLAPGDRAIACINAGIDLLLEGSGKECLPLELAEQMALELTESINAGKIELAALLESSKRIQNLKLRLKEIQKCSNKETFSVIGCQKHKALVESLTA